MGAYSRAKGIRFERAVATRLRTAGFEVRRNLEYDGWATGIDLVAFDPGTGRQIPVAIQCKNTKRATGLELGLQQARAGWPDAAGWVCLWNAGGSAGWRILIQGKNERDATLSTWDQLCKFLWWSKI